jgi:nucleotide-binding universal stress UspA family protein
MIRSVLVPLDGSPLAEQALPPAAAIARAFRAKLRLVMVHQPLPAPRSPEQTRIYVSAELGLRRAERVYLRRQAQGLRAENRLAVVTVTLDDAVPEAIARYARATDVGLVAMTTHGRGPLSRLWLGSVADELVRTLAVPILLIRPREGQPASAFAPGQRILVPLDGSALGEAALEPAAELATRLELGLTLVHVVEPPVLMGDGAAVYPVSLATEWVNLRRRESEEYLGRVAEPLRARGLEVDTLTVVRGGVADAVLELAHAADVALVALSTHGRGGLQRLLLGSVADKLVRAAERPVLVVRPTGAKRARPARRTLGARRRQRSPRARR